MMTLQLDNNDRKTDHDDDITLPLMMAPWPGSWISLSGAILYWEYKGGRWVSNYKIQSVVHFHLVTLLGTFDTKNGPSTSLVVKSLQPWERTPLRRREKENITTWSISTDWLTDWVFSLRSVGQQLTSQREPVYCSRKSLSSMNRISANHPSSKMQAPREVEVQYHYHCQIS